VRLNREGQALFDRGEYAAAVDRFERAVQLAPRSALYRNNLGWALFQAGRLDAAARELEETTRLDPRRGIAYANIGEVLWARGDRAGAIAAYERFLQLNTDARRERIAEEKLRRMRAASARAEEG
jgi:Flp pilus assembly protein TadD